VAVEFIAAVKMLVCSVWNLVVAFAR
jgi:hypothetical protein